MKVEQIKSKYLGDDAASLMRSISNVSAGEALKMIEKIKAQFQRNIGALELNAKNPGISGKVSKNVLNAIKKMAKAVGAAV